MVGPYDIKGTPAGRRCLLLAARLDPSAIHLAVALLEGNVVGARIYGWVWGVRCARYEVNSKGHRFVRVLEAIDLAATFGPINHAIRPLDLLLPRDLAPISCAERAIRQVELTEGRILSTHFEAINVALNSVETGKEVGLNAWDNFQG